MHIQKHPDVRLVCGLKKYKIFNYPAIGNRHELARQTHKTIYMPQPCYSYMTWVSSDTRIKETVELSTGLSCSDYLKIIESIATLSCVLFHAALLRVLTQHCSNYLFVPMP